jgi:exodeoxyribonuclease V gamma subunit
MSLQVQYVSRLSDVLAPALEYLRQPVDIFAKQHIVVPTAGVKAWLMSEVAKQLGTSNSNSQDGIIANVEVDFPGSLTKFLKPPVIGERDPWLIENLTFHVLDVISADAQYEPIIKRSGGPLIAARAIADRFDRYHVRRPAMIRLWEQGKATVSPTAHNPNAKQLNATDMWQFQLWSEVRKRISQPSPAARKPELSSKTPKQILVVGFQSLSPGQIDALLQLEDHVEVRVVLVHPSQAISQKWGVTADPSVGLIPERNPAPSMPADIDPLVNAWLLGSQELETLLASQQIEATHVAHAGSTSQNLLNRMQQTVSQHLVAVEQSVESDDRSLTIHRCHNLSRQVEVLHDALLHAFTDLKDLQPHEIVVLCPNIEAAAPYLEATFARVLKVNGRSVKLPLEVADRGIRQVNEGAALLVGLIDLVGSRCSVDGVLAVATSPLVLKNLGVNSEGVEHWYRYADNTNVRWGLTVEHRKEHGLEAPNLSAHTWRNALEQMILGALVPDGTQTFDALGVDALDDVDLSDVDDIAALIRVFDAVLALSDLTNKHRTVNDWCDAIESAMVALCGENCDKLPPPIKQIGLLRSSAVDSTVEIPYSDVASQLSDMLNQLPGKQPLRTGAITATSMIPLRGVPFRVVCVVGFDEESLSSNEGEGDDLIERQRLIGDQDARLDVRRALLDSVLAAQDRLIITCTGQSIKNNQRLPLATPLAEFVDFARRLGVGKHPKIKHLSAIEVEHPRHTTSVRNFFKDEVQSGIIWSHDDVARQAATTLGDAVVAGPLSTVAHTSPIVLTPELLETTYIKPLDIYIRQTLDIFSHRKNEKEIPATIPLTIDKKEMARLAEELLFFTSANPSSGATDDWNAEVRRSGVIPPAPFSDDAIDEVHQLVKAMQANLAAKSIDVATLESVEVDIDIAPGVKVVGSIPMCTQGPEMITTAIYFGVYGEEYEWVPADMRIAIRLLIARAAGLPITQGFILARHEEWPKKPKYVVRELSVDLDSKITQVEAQKRLAVLCDMARTALVSPCASFGDTAEAEDKEKITKFNAFVSADNFHKKDEFFVFGDDPDFKDVFHSKSPIVAFWQKHKILFTVPKKPAINNPKVHVIS